MRTLIMVMAHADVQDTVDRHMPYWNKLGRVWISCPPSSIVKTCGPVLAIGVKGHNGPEANARFKKIMNCMNEMDYDWFQLHEYDSLCLADTASDQLDPGKIWANVFTNNQPQFKGGHFFHPPLTMTKKVLGQMCRALDAVNDQEEHGFWDRLAGYACELAGVPFAGYGARGFAKNTIEQQHIGEAASARRNGACWFHGVKSGAVLNAICN
jgi:hypothetical protein